jgi:hypothetical protein
MLAAERCVVLDGGMGTELADRAADFDERLWGAGALVNNPGQVLEVHIVASLYQTPFDPFEQVSTHRPLDYWGRNMIDHLIARLPEALAPDGVAYIMQLSIIGMRRTVELLTARGFDSRVVDFSFFEFHDLFLDKKDQILRVEELSDAYHLTLGDTDVIVAYLVEVTPAKARA